MTISSCLDFHSRPFYSPYELLLSSSASQSDPLLLLLSLLLASSLSHSELLLLLVLAAALLARPARRARGLSLAMRHRKYKSAWNYFNSYVNDVPIPAKAKPQRPGTLVMTERFRGDFTKWLQQVPKVKPNNARAYSACVDRMMDTIVGKAMKLSGKAGGRSFAKDYGKAMTTVAGLKDRISKSAWNHFKNYVNNAPSKPEESLVRLGGRSKCVPLPATTTVAAIRSGRVTKTRAATTAAVGRIGRAIAAQNRKWVKGCKVRKEDEEDEMRELYGWMQRMSKTRSRRRQGTTHRPTTILLLLVFFLFLFPPNKTHHTHTKQVAHTRTPSSPSLLRQFFPLSLLKHTAHVTQRPKLISPHSPTHPTQPTRKTD